MSKGYEAIAIIVLCLSSIGIGICLFYTARILFERIERWVKWQERKKQWKSLVDYSVQLTTGKIEYNDIPFDLYRDFTVAYARVYIPLSFIEAVALVHDKPITFITDKGYLYFYNPKAKDVLNRYIVYKLDRDYERNEEVIFDVLIDYLIERHDVIDNYTNEIVNYLKFIKSIDWENYPTSDPTTYRKNGWSIEHELYRYALAKLHLSIEDVRKLFKTSSKYVFRDYKSNNEVFTFIEDHFQDNMHLVDIRLRHDVEKLSLFDLGKKFEKVLKKSGTDKYVHLPYLYFKPYIHRDKIQFPVFVNKDYKDIYTGKKCFEILDSIYQDILLDSKELAFGKNIALPFIAIFK